MPDWDILGKTNDTDGEIIFAPFVLLGIEGGSAAPVPDTTPPAVTWVSPSPGGNLPENGEIVLEVTDVNYVGAFITISFTQNSSRVGRPELVYDVDGFDPGYAGSSISPITNGFQLTLRRTGGWPLGLVPTVKVTPFDSAGN